MIDHAQWLGKFSLDHVNGIIKVLLDIKKNIVQFNVSEQQKINDILQINAMNIMTSFEYWPSTTKGQCQ